jgi:hypothetical protein
MKLITFHTEHGAELKSPWTLLGAKGGTEPFTLCAQVLDSVTGLTDTAGVTWSIKPLPNSASIYGLLTSGTWSQVPPASSRHFTYTDPKIPNAVPVTLTFSPSGAQDPLKCTYYPGQLTAWNVSQVLVVVLATASDGSEREYLIVSA